MEWRPLARRVDVLWERVMAHSRQIDKLRRRYRVGA